MYKTLTVNSKWPREKDIFTSYIHVLSSGQKYNSAFKFGVKVVNINWLYDSIEKKSCQSNEEYVVKSEGTIYIYIYHTEFKNGLLLSHSLYVYYPFICARHEQAGGQTVNSRKRIFEA